MEPDPHSQVGRNAARWPVRKASSRLGRYEIECIAGCFILYGRTDYLIKYKRYRTLEWTPRENLGESLDEVKRFTIAMGWKGHKRRNGTWYLPDHLWNFDEEAIDSVITEDNGSGPESITILCDELVAVAREHGHQFMAMDDMDFSEIPFFGPAESDTTLTADSRDESVPRDSATPPSPLPIAVTHNRLDEDEVECDLSADWDDGWDFPVYQVVERDRSMRRQQQSPLSPCWNEAIEDLVVENQRPAASNQHQWVTELEKLTGQLGKMPAIDKP